MIQPLHRAPSVGLTRRAILPGLCLTIVGMAQSAQAGLVTNVSIAYRGFKIDLAGFGTPAETEAAAKVVREQIDMVERVGLPSSLLGFFKTMPLRVGHDLRGFFGTYYQGAIALSPDQLDSHNPTLLHEFMHAVHDKRLPDSFANKEIAAFYTDAFYNKRYEGTNGAYFLLNAHEFFAVTATVFLYGKLPRNRPYARSEIRTAQPDYYKFLAKLFGSR